jgi:hypothetical protein
LKDVKLFFVRSPFSTEYKERVEEVISDADSIFKEHTDISKSLFRSVYFNEFYDIPLLDFIDFSSEKDEFYDEYHLNLKGSIRFSKFFDGLVKKGLLNDTANYRKMIENEVSMQKTGKDE